MQHIEKLKVEEENKKELKSKECCKDCKNGQQGKCHEKILKTIEKIKSENKNQDEK